MLNNLVYQEDNYSQDLYLKLLGMHGAEFSELKKALAIDDNSRILSLACGNGVIEKKTINNFSNFVGVDYSKTMLNSFNFENNRSLNLNKSVFRNEDVLTFLKKNDNKFNLCFANGFLPFYRDKKIDTILNAIYNSLEVEGLLSFYVEQRTINWFEYEPKETDDYNNDIFSFFTVVNKYRKLENIEPYSKFYDSIYWDEKIKKSKLFKLQEKIELHWDNSNLTFNELIQIFSGEKKVLNLCFKISEVNRSLMREELEVKFKDKLNIKPELKMSRIFYILKKNG